MNIVYPWQNLLWQYLVVCKDTEKVPHAILFKGVAGIGKLHLAICFAEFLLCFDKNKTSACGYCRSCQLVHAKLHPDLIIVKSDEKNKQIKIDQIREAIKDLTTTSQQGGYKILIINQAELLNINAANALLKTLEEPAPGVIILLVAGNLTEIAPTIISRCQILSIDPPSYKEAQSWLRQNINQALVSEEQLNLVFTLTQNSPLKTLELINSNYLAKRTEFFKYFYAIGGEEKNIVQISEQYLKWDLSLLLMMFMVVVSDLIKIKFNQGASIANQDQVKEFALFTKKLTSTALFAYYAKLLDIKNYLTKGINFNQQLLIEDLIISWINIHN